MMWQEVNLLYGLKSPVHIGYLPSRGSVISPTRHYVPGKNFWGAYTKVLTETLFDYPTPKNYQDVGNWLKKNVRFTYVYICDSDSLLSPEYTEEGLKYGKNTTLSEFQNKFIGSFVSTAIDAKSGTAKDESLHEIEFINPKYPSGLDIKNTRIFGKMFVKKKFSTEEIEDVCKRIKVNKRGITVDSEDPFKTISIGGEVKYGFGRIEKIDETQLPRYRSLKFNPDSNEISVSLQADEPILSHVDYRKGMHFKGDIELISGRGYRNGGKNEKSMANTHINPGESISRPRVCFAPGTVFDTGINIVVDEFGVWRLNE